MPEAAAPAATPLPARGFPPAEYQRRVTALQASMAQAGMEALLLTTPPDIYYTTGFLTRFWESPARPWFVVVPALGAPVAVIPAIGADLMARTWVRDIRTWEAPDPQDDGVSLLSEALAELVPPSGAIGVPMGLETHLRMPLGDYARVIQRLAPRRILDATATVQRVREVKSDAEIAKIRAICGIADQAFAQVPEFAAAGVPLDQVFRDFQVALLQAGADWVSYTAGGAGQGGYGDVISPAEAVPLRKGDIVMLDTGAVRDGYFCDFDRNYAVGPPSDDARRAHDALTHATEVALATLRPGMRAADLHRILCDALSAKGATPLGGRLGHGLGLTLTEWPSLTARDQTELRAGMVLTLEPGVEVAKGKILVHEENIVLRDTGPELLSPRAPAILPELAL
ncbi:M24 family metallopeptidase [Pararhodobacter oceanensis]|uniref:Peptidase M24 n=1 Tax=Pararhodobacter oceanensis TaxID=2172121 RepID=A0A2T8HSQ3_9RHOB|nr:Xaa-Pro peptidase family protein [Pararhodobacter oceanensis]PVH28474.1 peptidase M24 [Pararhodobacter oceanensis]